MPQIANIAVRKGRALPGESLTHHSVLTRSVAAPIVMLGGIFKLNNLAPRMYFGSPRTESRVNSILAFLFSQREFLSNYNLTLFNPALFGP